MKQARGAPLLPFLPKAAAGADPNSVEDDLMYMQRTAKGHPFDEATSSFQKALRRGQPNAALYWGEELWCLAPSTKILRADLRWVNAGDVAVGDRLLGFDEHNVMGKRQSPDQYRRWRITPALSVVRLTKPCYRLTFDDGTMVIASSDHLWLAAPRTSGGRGLRWISTESMTAGEKGPRTHVLRLTTVAQREESFETGRVSGLFDGEGHVDGQFERDAAKKGLGVGFSQNPGPELEFVKTWLTSHGFDYGTNPSKRGKGCVTVNIKGGVKEVLRFLMLARPERLLRKFLAKVESASIYGREGRAVAALVSKEFLGPQEVIAIGTESSTLIAEGLASHNCKFPGYFWRRLLVIVSEDLSADPMTAVVIGQLAVNAFIATKGFEKKPTGLIEAQAVLVAARAPKSREACDAHGALKRAKADGWTLAPPDYALDMHTTQGKKLRRSFRHFGEEGRRVAGDPPTPNEWELTRWGFRAKPATDPDVEMPAVKDPLAELRAREKPEFDDIPPAQ